MKSYELDEIPEAYQNAELSLEQACITIYSIVYNNPARFKLIDLEEDDRSEFLLLFLQRRVEKLLTGYDKSICKFGAYIFFALSKLKKNYLSRKISSDYFDRLYLNDTVYEQMQNITNHKDELILKDEPVEYCANLKNETPKLIFKRVFEKPHYIYKSKTEIRNLKLGLILLALKSAWYINDEQICKISKVADFPSTVLNDSICKLKASLINKSLCRKKIEHARNKAYNYANFYKDKKVKFDNDGVTSDVIDRKIDRWEKLFSNKTDFLKSSKLKISPTNEEINKVTGIKPYRISYLLKKIRNMDLDQIKVNELLN